MKTRIAWILGAAVVAASGMALAQGEPMQPQTKEQQKACGDLERFRASVQKLQETSPQSTVGEVERDAKQAKEDLEKFARSAEKAARPETENVRWTVERLRDDLDDIPEAATSEQVRLMVESDVEQVRIAARGLESKLGCGMGGAGTEGYDLEPEEPMPEEPLPDEQVPQMPPMEYE